MTLVQEEQIECPECGHSQSVRIWQSVNVTLEPQLKQDLLNGKINWFKCGICEFESFMPLPLMYHDMDLKFCVQLVPFDQAMDPIFLKNFSSDGTFKTRGILPKDIGAEYMSNQHVVFSMSELVYYMLFREKLAELHEGEPSA